MARGRDLVTPIRHILDDCLDASAKEFDQAVTLPPECYTSHDFFEFEKAAIFSKEWLCLGREEQIPSPGDWYSITVIDEPLIVCRAENDDINVLSAVCRHRCNVITAPGEGPPETWSSPPPETSGNSERFTCPYHFWTYDLSGRLVAAPAMDRTSAFDKSQIRLPQLKVERWCGFIFANFDPDAPSLIERLSGLSTLLENWHLDKMRSGEQKLTRDMPWNWKVMHENSIEGYHIDRLHRGLHEVLPSGTLVPTEYDPNSAAILIRHRAAAKDYSLNPTYKALMPVIETLTDEQREESIFALIAPTLLIGMNVDSALYRIVLPNGPDSIDLRFGNLFPEDRAYGRRFEEIKKMTTYGLMVMTSQDFPTDAAVQKGLRSRFASRGRYSWQEFTLGHFNQWLVPRYLAAVEEAAGS